MRKPLETKLCPVCQIEKPRSDYYKKLDTISHKCKLCTKADNSSRSKKYFGKYAEYQNQWRRDRYKSDPLYREKVLAQKQTFYDINRNVLNEKRRVRWATDPANPARLHYRRKDVKLKTPVWVSKQELLEIYSKCPSGMEVDHIIPLKGLIDGRPVSGLHVPWNLQYLTKEQNRKKYNRISENDIAPFSLKR